MIMEKERANGEGGASSAGGTCWLDGYKPRAPHPPAYNKKMDSVRARRLLGTTLSQGITEKNRGGLAASRLIRSDAYRTDPVASRAQS